MAGFAQRMSPIIWRRLSKPRPITNLPGTFASRRFWKTRTAAKWRPYFAPRFSIWNRLTVSAGASLPQSLAEGFHHLFVHRGTATVSGRTLAQGRSYLLPALLGEYALEAGDKEAIILKTYLPM